MGARYRKIDPRIWTDEDFRDLKSLEKLVAFYLLTAQSNRIGIFNFSPGKACEDLGITHRTLMENFDRVCSLLGWEWDKKTRVIYIPSWFKYNLPVNPNVLKSCLGDLHELPATKLKQKFVENIRYLPTTFHPIFHQTFPEGLPKPSHQPSAKQEQDKELEKELDQEGETPHSSADHNGHLSDEDFINQLRLDPKFEAINIDAELVKMNKWLESEKGAGRNLTRNFVVGWLNKAEPPLRIKSAGTGYQFKWVYCNFNCTPRCLGRKRPKTNNEEIESLRDGWLCEKHNNARADEAREESISGFTTEGGKDHQDPN